MLNLILILLGLISNPNSSNNTSNCGGDGSTPAVAQPNPGDTGGDTAHPIPPKIIGG